MNDRLHNKNIEDLLKNFKARKTEELDDFEREALEGFEMLDSREEAFELKSSLDKRANEELFEQKKNGHRVYWFAAAALFLVIGLSVFFILNNQSTVDKNVAYVQPVQGKEIPDEKLTAAPTEEAETAEPKTTQQEKVPVTALKKDLKRSENNEKKGEGGGISSRAVLKPAQDRSASNEAGLAADKRNADDKLSTETGKQAGKDMDFETANTETKKLEEKNERENVSKEQVADQLAFSDESKARDEETQKSTKKSYRSKGKEKAAASKAAAEADYKSLANNSVAASGSTAENNKNDSQPVSTTSPGSPAAEQKSFSPVFIQGPAKADEYNSPTNTCYYTGGASDLIKDVRTKLTEENVNKQFDVLLNINEKKKVEKVVYLNVYDLTTTERDKVTKILMSLDKFNFYIQPNRKSLFEFKLLYKP